MIAILQPFIPHYREQFFNQLQQKAAFDLYCYEADKLGKQHFAQGQTPVKPVRAFSVGPFVVYNPFRFLKKDYKVLVLMLNFGHISTWLILLMKPLLRRKIILWGHGISVKRYVREEQQPHILLKWMVGMSDGIWFYTRKEQELWQRFSPAIKGYALNNTISGVESILQLAAGDKAQLKAKYGITQPRVLIYCARFNEPGRRADLLEQLIARLDPAQFGVIIIGDGKLKPDFSPYSHVYDFGALYDRQVKDELFSIADIYFQPGWVGLSIVEAMAYGKPVFTLRRSSALLQCVEYSYIQHGYNGMVFDSVEDCLQELPAVSDKKIAAMGANAREYVSRELTMNTMIENAFQALKSING
ncbi:glycosyltransferase [Chitinophaga japonensis]|uniref:Glycosyltransferase involved in cell wall biosynthesis n=1 Tax=Chitinophaga japonensis TaxID=104662 RepID=A0A562T5C5_CHIJA|nr:glycosyltransferase [Chitinophaga japonensis]TWI88735.1 glycosyltransferase involved in cell wall biosynthesis [Chitinophaga japonensis]